MFNAGKKVQHYRQVKSKPHQTIYSFSSGLSCPFSLPNQL
jgi:hypothetical protein